MRRSIITFKTFLIAVAIFSVITVLHQRTQHAADKEEITSKIESALYTRAEFFGAQAIVPFPTAEARNRLQDLSKDYPNEAQIFLNLSQLEEKLGNYDKAETALRRYADLQSDKTDAMNQFANYYHRRAEFEKEAATLEETMNVAKPNERVSIMERMIELGRIHKLEKYLSPKTYEKLIKQDTATFTLIQTYADKLIEQENYEDALKITTEYKPKFPEQKNYFLKQEISILEQLGKTKEAENVYHADFNPFWSVDEAVEYYQFLSGNDRLRIYGKELRAKFRDDPTNFDVAVRLYHYMTYSYYSEQTPDIFSRLESERAKRCIKWSSEELTAVVRLMIAAGDGNSASRFLYTLYTNGELKKGNELRGKILYQLFELFIAADDERLALTRGDLQFYADVAKSDPHPGMIGGVLSLLFSDTHPQQQLDSLEAKAIKHFNRAAAFRVFNAYKEEFPTSPQLAQMYLDIVRMYVWNKEVDKASKTLEEFEKRYSDAPEFPDVALRLADAYSTLNKREEERNIYQKILDYYGKNKKEGVTLIPSVSNTDTDQTSVAPSLLSYPFTSNEGIYTSPKRGDGYYYQPSRYVDFVGDELKTDASYQTVLSRYVSSLNQDKRFQDILALYANEVKKHPDEQGLYEQWLQWLGQTNFIEEQFRVYQEATKRFATTSWNDRLARWFLNRERKSDFEKFSRELLSKMNDAETENYLSKFIANNSGVRADAFEGQLYLGLYSLAHKRFPHNLAFVRGLLNFYSIHKQPDEWRALMAEYYFESEGIRQEFLRHLAEKNELRAYLNRARESAASSNEQKKGESSSVAVRGTDSLPYKLFRADASVWLSNYEEAIDAYRELNRLYPNTPEFANRLVSFTRSFGQRNRKFLEESAAVQKNLSDAFPSDAIYRTRSGEIQAELGNYDKAKGEWEQLIALGKGEEQMYLDTATVYWDYYQYDDALLTINALRKQVADETLYAFQAGAIYEAKHQMPEALSEYVKALDENSDDYYRAESRLKKLWKREGFPTQFEKAFNQTKQSNNAIFLGYASFLISVDEKQKAVSVLRSIASDNNQSDVLERAVDLFSEADDTEGQEQALKRLIQTAESPRYEIWYRLRLANAMNENGKRDKAIFAMKELTRKFSTNNGVLSQAANFFWRIGSRDESLRVLQSGVQRGKGKFHYQFAMRLASKQLELNQNIAAQKTLESLHDENKLDASVFHLLARAYVRTNNQTALRRVFDETIVAIKKQDSDPKSKEYQIADLREEMIDVFTRIKDYTSAIDQHIEVINRNTDDETKLEAAIEYAKRYGGAERLLVYYQKTSQTAYKDYRWNVVLARIYEANKDYEKATQEYRTAIANQPEMLELYDALARVYQRAKNYDAAIAALNKTLELSNDDPQYVRRLIEVLLEAGRKAEANTARQKLPPETKPEQTLAEKFREAETLRTSEKEKAVATYKEAINAILSEPLKHDLKASEITGYVQTVSEVEGLQSVTKTLWTLREKLLEECEGSDSRKAREQLQTLDGAMSESIGGFAVEKASGEELTALYSDLNSRIENTLEVEDKYGTLSLLTNIAHRAGFVALEEKVLVAQKEIAFLNGKSETYHTNLRTLVSFYQQQNKFNRILELLNAENKRDSWRDEFNYWQLIAENARLIGDSSQELEALRQNYQQAVGKQKQASELLVERYFNTLLERGDEGRNEIRTLFEKPSQYHQKLISLLLAKNEKALAHEAIDKARESKAWRLARNAETSNALKEYDAQNENYFLQVLQFTNIGELIKQKPDATQQAIGNEWFKLANTYGEWLYATDKDKSRFMLPALVENRPQDADEQAKLGRWYLKQRDATHALEHLYIALEMNPDDNSLIADYGIAFFMYGNTAKAKEIWERIIANESPSLDDFKLYLETLTKNGLADEARKKLYDNAVRELKFYSGENYEEEQYGRKLDEPKNIIRALALSFDKKDRKLTDSEEKAKADFFLKLYETSPTTHLLSETLLKENLIQREKAVPFYQILIKNSDAIDRYDYDSEFQNYLGDDFKTDEAEEIYFHQNEYEAKEPTDDILERQQEYLDWLLEFRENNDARKLVAEIETELKGKFVRPQWLRLAKARLLMREKQTAQALFELRHFVGIETHQSVTKVLPPNIERLNEAVAMLESEGFDNEANQLQESAYARSISLGQYDSSSFVGLAKISFGRGDSKSGLEFLQMMIRLGDEETATTTESEIAAMPLIKSHAITDTTIEQPEPSNGIDFQTAISLAAQTASEYEQTKAAIEFRKQLHSLAPLNAENRLELARLLAADGEVDEATTTLVSIINDRNITRYSHWQAVWLSQEIIGDKKELWSRFTANDKEFQTALTALALFANGQTDETLKQVNESVIANPNPELQFFYALMLKRNNRLAEALDVFNSIQSERTSPFVYAEDNALRQAIRLYLALGQPRAALKLAEKDSELKKSEIFDSSPKKYQLFSERTKWQTANSKLDLLTKLAQTAEQIKDFDLAIMYETARLNSLVNENEKRETEARINRLRGVIVQP